MGTHDKFDTGDEEDAPFENEPNTDPKGDSIEIIRAAAVEHGKHIAVLEGQIASLSVEVGRIRRKLKRLEERLDQEKTTDQDK